MTLGLCSQIDLDAEVKKAAARLARERGTVEPGKVETLLPAEETIRGSGAGAGRARGADGNRACPRGTRGHGRPEEEEDVPDANSVFAKLKDLKRD